MVSLYPYTSGDAFEERRRYNYAPYAGRPFLQAWGAMRRPLLPAGTSAPAVPSFPLPTSAARDDALEALAHAWQDGAGAAEWQALRRLIQHFEVGQRIYGAYGPGFVPQDRSDYHDLQRYLLAAQLFESAYTQDHGLDALNALLKMLDLISTRARDLDAAQRARLGRLAQCEARHVEALGQALEVTW